MLDLFLNLDVRTLVMVLFAGNLVSVGLVCAFLCTTAAGRDAVSCMPLLLAKAFQAGGYFLLIQRELAHPLLSVNLGNSLAFIGFYYEAIAILRILNETKQAQAFQRGMLCACLLGFNALEFAYHSPALRVASASLCILLNLFIPCLRLFISPNSGRFKHWVGVMYLCVLAMLVPRALYGLLTDIHLFSNNYVQTLTFLAMVVQLVFSLPAYLLLIKEDTDKTIAVMATTDMLTGLPNRYSFLDAAQRIFTRSSVNSVPIAVLFLDIDLFKHVNDTYGHNFGDTVLAALGRAVHECLRPTDLSCRYGGEEFVVLLQKAETSTAVLVAERIRAAAAGLSFPEYPDFRFSLSVGVVAGVPSEAGTLDLFIGRADSALYIAKRSGRNRVTTYEDLVLSA